MSLKTFTSYSCDQTDVTALGNLNRKKKQNKHKSIKKIKNCLF